MQALSHFVTQFPFCVILHWVSFWFPFSICSLQALPLFPAVTPLRILPLQLGVLPCFQTAQLLKPAMHSRQMTVLLKGGIR